MDEVLQLAMQLPDEDRLQLAEALWASVGSAGQPPFAAEWVAEAKRRSARIAAGEGRSSTWAEVRDRARKSLKESAGG
jgi:putative addiction module component (TIGR02574 family)